MVLSLNILMSFLVCFIPLLGLIFSLLGLRHSNKTSAIVGLILSVLVLIYVLFLAPFELSIFV